MRSALRKRFAMLLPAHWYGNDRQVTYV